MQYKETPSRKSSSATRILAIFKNTISKEMRRKSLAVIFLLTLIVIFALNRFAESLTMNINGKVIEGVGGLRLVAVFYIIAFWNEILAILISVDTVRSDMDTGVIQSILSRNITRSEYLTGRVLGSWAIILLYYLLSLLITVAYSWGGEIHRGTILRFTGAIAVSSVSALIYIFWGILASRFFPKLQAFLLVLVLMVTVSFVNGIYSAPGANLYSLPTGLFAWIGTLVQILLPRTGTLNGIAKSLVGDNLPDLDYLQESIHLVVTWAALGATAFQVFLKKDITER